VAPVTLGEILGLFEDSGGTLVLVGDKLGVLDGDFDGDALGLSEGPEDGAVVGLSVTTI
jgi:hypothetical protein